MPDTLSLSAGVSLGLLAGIVSGVCYLVANTFPRSKTEIEDKKCVPSSQEDGVCRKCGGDHRGGLIPCICHKNTPVKFESGAWFLRQMQRAFTVMPWSISTDKLEQIDEECDGYENPGPSDPSRGELKKIREFLETISAKLAGGPLEGTKVAPLYDHPAYLPPLRNASPTSAANGGASGAHVQLKRLVARVVEEAAALPALARYAAEPHTPSLESSTYEDLLASAILNKVIERYQNENGSGGRSSGIHSASASPTPSERSSPRSLHSRHTRDITPPLHEEDDVSDWEERDTTDDALEVPRRVPFPEFGGDIVHRDNEDREFDEVSGSDLQAVDGTWEENWLFQRKKIKTQSVPVPMLVPNSNTEYRALIGDRDADDTTDLSDNASDSEEQTEEYKSDMKKVIDSKHIIGGQLKLDESDFEPDSLTIIDASDEFEKLVDDTKDSKTVDAIINEINDNNVTIVETVNVNSIDQVDGKLHVGIESGPLPKAEFVVKEEIHRTLLNGHSDDLTENIYENMNGNKQNGVSEELHNGDSYVNNKDSMNTLSQHEREGEYEETVTRPVQRYADSLRRKHFDDGPQPVSIHDSNQDEELMPGTIAYRERKKWLNFVEMPNNPYSPEAIQKRLSSKSTSSVFDMFTTKNESDDDKIEIPDEDDERHDTDSVKGNNKINLDKNNFSNNGDERNGIKSSSPKILQDVMADEIPQYKRYGRDYYIREAKSSCGGRKKTNMSDTSSISSMNKSTSLENFDTEITAPVSASSSLSDLEASALHQNIVRAVLSPRNASPNFAINPIFENPDRQNDNADENHAINVRDGKKINGLLIKQFNMIATNQHYTKLAGHEDMSPITTTIHNKDNIMIDYEDVSESSLFAATPVYVDDDTDKKFDEILETAYKTVPSQPPPPIPVENDEREEPLKSPNSVDNSYISTSSMEDSIKIYNVQTGEIIKCTPEDNVSVRYDADTNDKNISEVDSFSSGNDVHDTTVIDDSVDDKLEIESDDILQNLPKVKELAKKFVSMENLEESGVQTQHQHLHLRRRRSKDNILTESNMNPEKTKQMYMHSLTARSISRQFREELKLSMSTPLTVPGGSKQIPEGIEEVSKESSRPGSPVPEPGNIKTKLAFFESLKSKFSNK